MRKQLNINNMKNLNCKTIRKLVFTLLMLLTLALNAQQYQYTVKFLGIPVDGSKSEMISKLKKKNFKYDSYKDQLSGKFNGKDVYVMIHTNHDIVDRICVMDRYLSNSSDIKINFNILLKQFKENPNYDGFLAPNMEIPNEEDIQYEMTINDKRYQASFHQQFTSKEFWDLWNDSIYRNEWFNNNYYDYELDSIYNMCEDEMEFLEKIAKSFWEEHWLDAINNNDVWFTISSDRNNKYRIVLYYDNKRNRPNGEDL